MRVRRVVRPKVPIAPPSIKTAVQFLASLLFVAVMMVPFNVTAARPLTVRVTDAAKAPIEGACVTEVWPAYSAREVPGAIVDTVARTASDVFRTDTIGVARLPARTARASGWRRIGERLLRLISWVFGGNLRPTVYLTVLGPGYEGEAYDLGPANTVVTIVTRADVQSPALRSRFSRSCVP